MNIEEWFTKYRVKIGKRAASFELALKLLRERFPNDPTIIETGTLRDDTSDYHFAQAGCSTYVLADYVANFGGRFLSVDILGKALQNAHRCLGDLAKHVQFVLADSVSFLAAWPITIHLVYLDSMDYDEQEPTKSMSQQHSHNELLAVLPKLDKQSLILIDDCELPGGGKGLLSRQHLHNLGWKEIYNGYQSLWSLV
jgi:hypothetical protein